MMLQTETILMQSKRILHAKTRDRGAIEQRSERKISLLIFPSKAALYLDIPRAPAKETDGLLVHLFLCTCYAD